MFLLEERANTSCNTILDSAINYQVAESCSGQAKWCVCLLVLYYNKEKIQKEKRRRWLINETHSALKQSLVCGVKEKGPTTGFCYSGYVSFPCTMALL